MKWNKTIHAYNYTKITEKLVLICTVLLYTHTHTYSKYK